MTIDNDYDCLFRGLKDTAFAIDFVFDARINLSAETVIVIVISHCATQNAAILLIQRVPLNTLNLILNLSALTV